MTAPRDPDGGAPPGPGDGAGWPDSPPSDPVPDGGADHGAPGGAGDDQED